MTKVGAGVKGLAVSDLVVPVKPGVGTFPAVNLRRLFLAAVRAPWLAAPAVLYDSLNFWRCHVSVLARGCSRWETSPVPIRVHFVPVPPPFFDHNMPVVWCNVWALACVRYFHCLSEPRLPSVVSSARDDSRIRMFYGTVCRHVVYVHGCVR